MIFYFAHLAFFEWWFLFKKTVLYVFNFSKYFFDWPIIFQEIMGF
jgi:hypothetical protein